MKNRTIYTIAITYPLRVIMTTVAFARRNTLRAIAISALASIAYGVWQIHPPSAWIVVGSLFLLDLAFLKRKE